LSERTQQVIGIEFETPNLCFHGKNKVHPKNKHAVLGGKRSFESFVRHKNYFPSLFFACSFVQQLISSSFSGYLTFSLSHLQQAQDAAKEGCREEGRRCAEAPAVRLHDVAQGPLGKLQG
jgi:hypothetical protein